MPNVKNAERSRAPPGRRSPRPERSLGAGPHVRESLQAGEVPTPPPARSRSAAGRLRRSKARLPTCDNLCCEGPKPRPHNPPQVTPLLPALGLEAASASGLRGLVLSAEAPGRLSSTWGGLCPAPADPATGPAPARPSPVLIGSCSHPSPLDPPLDPPPAPP
ncbi:hypothetical protein ABFV05_002371 [Capra hircus]